MNLAKWTDFRCEEQGAALWIDCGQDVSSFFTTDAGVKWAQDLNLSVNLHAAKYTGVAQQLDQTNAFRGLCFSFLVFLASYLIYRFFRHQTSNQEPPVRTLGGERCSEAMLERRHEGQGEAWS